MSDAWDDEGFVKDDGLSEETDLDEDEMLLDELGDDAESKDDLDDEQ